MTYKLIILESAEKEWKKCPKDIQKQFKNKLKERLINPHNAKSKLSGAPNLYKIKLKSSGYRLVYVVEDDTIKLVVLAVGKREKNEIYLRLNSRYKKYKNKS